MSAFLSRWGRGRRRSDPGGGGPADPGAAVPAGLGLDGAVPGPLRRDLVDPRLLGGGSVVKAAQVAQLIWTRAVTGAPPFFAAGPSRSAAAASPRASRRGAARPGSGSLPSRAVSRGRPGRHAARRCTRGHLAAQGPGTVDGVLQQQAPSERAVIVVVGGARPRSAPRRSAPAGFITAGWNGRQIPSASAELRWGSFHHPQQRAARDGDSAARSASPR